MLVWKFGSCHVYIALKMSNQKNTVLVPESYPMTGGDGTYSYTKNSNFQKEAANVATATIDEAIAKKLDPTNLSGSNTFCLADLGCSVGPNTFTAMESIIEAVKYTYKSLGLASKIPEFQVFFNDHVSNDFNTLFASLPPERQYFAAGVAGSFHGRLFPESSLHFVYSSCALHWLSKVPEELLDKNSPAWNKGKIHYSTAPVEVVDAYAIQYAKDMEIFLDARAKEIVAGGMMVLIIPSIPDHTAHSSLPLGMMFDCVGASLMDMAKEGIISEAEVDSFNLPIYAASPKEMKQFVERNECFEIETMELTSLRSKVDPPVTGQACTMNLRSGMEVIISKHFGSKIIDELFDRFYKKIVEFFQNMESSYIIWRNLLVILKHK